MSSWYIQTGSVIIDTEPIKGSYIDITEKLRDFKFCEEIGISESFMFEPYKLVDAETIMFPEHKI